MIVSYLSPVAQSVLGHKVGDEVEFDLTGSSTAIASMRFSRLSPRQRGLPQWPLLLRPLRP